MYCFTLDIERPTRKTVQNYGIASSRGLSVCEKVNDAILTAKNIVDKNYTEITSVMIAKRTHAGAPIRGFSTLAHCRLMSFLNVAYRKMPVASYNRIGSFSTNKNKTIIVYCNKYTSKDRILKRGRKKT